MPDGAAGFIGRTDTTPRGLLLGVVVVRSVPPAWPRVSLSVALPASGEEQRWSV